VLDVAFASRDEALLAVAHGGALGTVRATERCVAWTCVHPRHVRVWTGEAVELRDAAVPPRAAAPLRLDLRCRLLSR
jgi:hypothetical protein